MSSVNKKSKQKKTEVKGKKGGKSYQIPECQNTFSQRREEGLKRISIFFGNFFRFTPQSKVRHLVGFFYCLLRPSFKAPFIFRIAFWFWKAYLAYYIQDKLFRNTWKCGKRMRKMSQKCIESFHIMLTTILMNSEIINTYS